MRFRRFSILLIVAMFGIWPAASSLSAQTQTTGDISGVVTDQTGAVVPGVTVTLKDEAKGTTQETATDRDGAYGFHLLAPGPYSVTVATTGFQTVNQTVRVALGSVTTANVQLTLGARTESVTVTESVPLVQSENGNEATTLNESQVQEIPNSGNDMSFTAELAPGIIANTAGGGLGNFSSFGLGADANLFTINGMDDNDPFLNLNNTGATDLMLGNNEVQEVSVVQNGYSAEYGGLAGAQVNVVTRGGTNQFHGRATYYWNGRVMNANEYFLNERGDPRSFVNANQWGADIGGPLVKNKVFWYFNTEGLYLVIPTSTQVAIPSPQFAAATQANIDSMFGPSSPEDAFYKNMFALWAAAPGASTATDSLTDHGCDGSEAAGTNTALSSQGFGPDKPCALGYQSAVSGKTHDWIVAGRMDWNIGNNDRMYTRIQKEHGLQASYIDPITPLFNLISDQPEYQGQYQWTHTIGSTAVNQFNASAQWYSATFNTPDLAKTLAAFPTTLIFASGALFSNADGTSLGSLDFVVPQGRNVTQYQISDDFSKTIGSHTLKAGIKFRRNDITDFDNGINTSGQLVPFTLDAFYMGGEDPATTSNALPNISELIQAFATVPKFPVAAYSVGGYIEDDWKVTNNLTLNLGFRLEHQSNAVCPINCFAAPVTQFTSLNHDSTIPYNQAIQIGRKQALYSLQAVNPQPRFGFAYSPHLWGMKDTVIRGGIGIFYDAFPDVVVDNFADNPPLFNLFQVAGGNLTPGGTNSLFTMASDSNAAFVSGFSSGATLADLQAADPAFAPPGLTSAQAHQSVPQVQKWSLGVEKGFGVNMSLSVGYVGNHAIHLPFFDNGLNAYDPTGTVIGFPLTPADARFGVVTQVYSNATSNYNGLVTSFTRRFGTGQVQINYVYGHALDDSSNSGNPNVTFESGQFGAANTSISFPEDPFNPKKYNYGNADYDVTHYLSANYVWTLPIRRLLMGHGFAPLVDGWQVSGVVFARSGLPYTLTDGGTSTSLGNTNYGTGALIFGVQTAPGGQNVNCAAEFPGQFVAHRNDCLNTAAFATPTNGPGGAANPLYGIGFGNVTRNQLRGPRYFDSDFTIMKYTKLPGWERGEFGLGFQFFNVFNHPNFQQPIGDVSSTSFGQVTSTVSPATSIFGSGLGANASPRLIQLKAQLRF
jgi:outer membrane receptor protein involved in Fe transport